MYATHHHLTRAREYAVLAAARIEFRTYDPRSAK